MSRHTNLRQKPLFSGLNEKNGSLITWLGGTQDITYPIKNGKIQYLSKSANEPYDLLSLVQLQMGIGSPKQHLFDHQFCVGVHQTFCEQWSKGLGKIFKFWPLHSVWQNIAGFRRGLFTCFLGHTPLLQYYLLFGSHPLVTIIKNQWCGPKSR